MKILAVLALISLAVGPVQEETRSITAALCNGGTITIPLDDEEPKPRRDCHQNACHAGSRREETKCARQ